ncbi:hypothetical protein INT48_001920 [Thamnidium elegans]|uniref:Uncharacterized protein n=1 Tax=Thamnidium elegans TaxID=101142 RepID=A0A8H7SMY4_9FUNG|nr:hypothetical protein INT48_001920 [Thamnidium elegans]
MTQTSEVTPPSPSLSTTSFISSISWTKKTPNELIPMLKNAYDTLKDKERGLLDLRLAAEIGKSLLENNKTLKSNYQDLLNTPYPTPTNSTSLVHNDMMHSQEFESELNYIPVNRTREALVEMLEKQNHDLSLQLEESLINQDKLDRKATKKTRQLKTEVDFLQSSLDQATRKIQELEEFRRKKTLTKEGGIDETWSDQHDQCVETFISQLKQENEQLTQSKQELEKNLTNSLQDLRTLKQQCQQFQFTAEGHEQLKQSFEAQNLHIQELKQSLEDHRLLFSRLRDRGIDIPSTFNSSIDGESTDDDDVNKYNLSSELENAWFKHQTSPVSSWSDASSIFQPFQAIYNQLPNVDSALESIILKAGVVEKDALDDALSLIGRLEDEYDHQKFLQEKRHIYCKQDYEQKLETDYDSYYEDTSFDEKTDDTIKSILYSTWRWFRFLIVMTIAIFLSLKQGPNGL